MDSDQMDVDGPQPAPHTQSTPPAVASATTTTPMGTEEKSFLGPTSTNPTDIDMESEEEETEEVDFLADMDMDMQEEASTFEGAEEQAEANGIMEPGGHIIRKANWYIETRNNFAKLLNWSRDELLQFITENEDLKLHFEQFKAKGVETNKKAKTRGQGIASHTVMYTSNPVKYTNPTTIQLADYTTQDYLIRYSALCSLILGSSGIFNSFEPKITEDNQFVWGYILLHTMADIETKNKSGENWFDNLVKQVGKKKATLRSRSQAQQDATRKAAGRERPQHLIVKLKLPMAAKEKSFLAGTGAPIPDLALPGLQTRSDAERRAAAGTPIAGKSTDELVALLNRGPSLGPSPEEIRERIRLEQDTPLGVRLRGSVLRKQLERLKQPGKAGNLKRYKTVVALLQTYVQRFFRDFDHVDVNAIRDRLQQSTGQLSHTGEISLEQAMAMVKEDFKASRKDRTALATGRNRVEGEADIAIALGPEGDGTDETAATSSASASKKGKGKGKGKATSLRRSGRQTQGPSGLPDVSVAQMENADMPEISKAHQAALGLMQRLIDGPEFQRDYLKEAVELLMIYDAEVLRMEQQGTEITLKFWQIIQVKWCVDVILEALTRGGLIADYVGLGKTLEYAATMHLDHLQTIQTYIEAPLNAKPPCRPWLVLTLPSLVAETAMQLKKFAPNFTRIFIVHSNPGIKTQQSITVIPKFGDAPRLFDPAEEINNRTCIITSYETFQGQAGPGALMAWAKDNKIKLEYEDDNVEIPLLHPSWPGSLMHKVRGVILDEPQLGLRNENKQRTAVEWLEAPKVFLYSGSPAPRGLQDFGSYLGLISNPELEREARQQLKDRARNIFYEEDYEFTTKTNPYILPEGHPARKYCYTRAYFDEFIGNQMQDPNLSAATRLELADMVKPTLANWILRRDYNSACPIGSKNTIAANMPPLVHYNLDTLFSPTAHVEYVAGYEQWAKRFMITADQETRRPAMPNPRTQRAVALLTFYPLLRHLHFGNPVWAKWVADYKAANPGKRAPSKMNAAPTEETERDWNSFFWEDSEFTKSMPDIGPNLKRWRWLLRQIAISDTFAEVGPLFNPKLANGTEIKPDDYLTSRVPNSRIIEEILRYSPKLQLALAQYLKHAIVRDEKIIFWFRWPIVQELFAEIMMTFYETTEERKQINMIDANTTAVERVKIRDRINDNSSNLRIIVAGQGVAGTGTNFQHGCHVAVHMDLCDTLDKEIQVNGRTHRLGSKHTCIAYSITVYDTTDQRAIVSIIENALAAKAAMIRFDRIGDALDSDDNIEDDLSKFLSKDFSGKDHPMSGWFEHRVEGEMTFSNIWTSEGQVCMRKLINDGLVKNSKIFDALMPPDKALTKMMTIARAQGITQHGGHGLTATTALSWVRQQEIEEREKYQLEMLFYKTALAKVKPGEDAPRKPRKSKRVTARVADKDGVWEPSAEQYWDEWDDKKRAHFRDHTMALFLRSVGSSLRWTPPAMTEGAVEKQRLEKAARQAEKGKSESATATSTDGKRKRTDKDSNPKPTKSFKSDEFIENSDLDSDMDSGMDSDVDA